MTPSFVRTLVLAFAVCAAGLTAGDELRIGALEGNSQLSTGPTASTLIDWSRPATATGSVNTASVGWTDATAPCDGIYFVRFYSIPSNALAAVMTAERGPYRAVNGINTVTFEPVAVTSETYIGIRRNEGAAACGMPYGTFTRLPSRALYTSADFKFGSNLNALSPLTNYRLAAQASSAPAVHVSTIPVVGTVEGNFASSFRTALTLSNGSPIEIRGKLRLRLIGRAGSDTDPTLDYVIPPNGTTTYPDLMAAMSQTGLASLDILTIASFTPAATARIFNDAGDAGTRGMTVDSVAVASNYYSVSTILIPQDLTKFRLNVGIRTFQGGDLQVVVYDAAGARGATLVKTYPADFFNQLSLADFLNGGTAPAGGKIVISAFQREFLAYGAVTDNTTNDPSLRIGLD